MASEAETLIRLNHPNLPHIVDYFPSESGQCGYLVMDYVEGETLLQRFERNGKLLSIDCVITYALQLCEVFEYLHGQQPNPIIHRDVKPANLMIDAHDRMTLIDFGIARKFKAGFANDTVQIGTIGFAAPEQFNQTQTDTRTDLYSLGALMYFLLSRGQYYYLTGTPLGQIEQQLPLPLPLLAIIDKLLRNNRDERYTTAAEVSTALRQVQQLILDRDSKSHSITTVSLPIDKKLIVLLSLYPGAGSTTVGLWLAGELRRYDIHHAFVEHPTNFPELFLRCNGSQEASEDYRFPVERIMQSCRLVDQDEWSYGTTRWYPLPPGEMTEGWNSEYQLRLLYEISVPVIIVDLSHHWEDATTQELIHQADEIVVVSSPHRVRLETSLTRARIEQLHAWSHQNKHISIIANRCDHANHSTPWLNMFNPLPIHSFPEIEWSRFLTYEWRGGSDAWEQCLYQETDPNCLQPCIQALFPEIKLIRHQRKLRSRNQRWRRWVNKLIKF